MNNAKRDEMYVIVQNYVKRYRAERKRVIEGILSYLEADKQAKAAYHKAVSEGATKMLLPPTVEATGRWSVVCCEIIRCGFGDYPQPTEIELTIHEHHVWKCPRCSKVYALRIQQPEE